MTEEGDLISRSFAGLLEGKTLLERIGQGNRMFCIDYVPGQWSTPRSLPLKNFPYDVELSELPWLCLAMAKGKVPAPMLFDHVNSPISCRLSGIYGQS